MFTGKAKKNAKACRFCWMCRHLCPIGLQTGREVNTPRAKGLIVSMMERGVPMDSTMAEAMYECLLCGLCTADCATGFDPPVFVREARTEAVLNGLVPPSVQNVIDRIQKTGNIYGLPPEEKWSGLKEIVCDLPEKADVLLYIGNTAAYKRPEIVKAFVSLLREAGVSFAVMKNEPSSGAELGDLIGYVEEVRRIAKDSAEAINATGVPTVVVLDPRDAAFFKHEYNEWNCELHADVQTATAFLAALVKEGKLNIKPVKKLVTYHDNTALARELNEYEPARELIAATGATLKEMFLNRSHAKCCGNELVDQYRPDLMELTAEGRWEDAKRSGASVLITASPQDYNILQKVVPAGMELEDLFCFLDQCVIRK